MIVSKLVIEDRVKRVVSYTENGCKVIVHLKQVPGCNTGDVQKQFNQMICRSQFQEALEFLRTKQIQPISSEASVS